MTMSPQDFFRQSTLLICGTLDLEQALFRFLKYAGGVLPLDQITVSLMEADLGGVRTVAIATEHGGMPLDVFSPLSGEIRRQLLSDDLPRLRLVNRPEEDPATRQIVSSLGNPDSSFIIMRLELEGARLGGAVVLRCNGRDRYEDGHLRLVSPLNEPFGIALSNFLRHREVMRLQEMLADDNRFLHRELRTAAGDEIIGREFGLRRVMEMVGRVAPRNSPVLLLGETGVGKEVIAGAIHHSSPRKDGPFIKVNCGAIPEPLVDSELFGHEKGAFTGAVSRRRGRFERAGGGTLFLDEIGELRPDIQVKLLRVLQNREIERVGGTETIQIDVRIIAATHQNLETMVAEDRFREDLFYRLNVFPVRVPPLRERKDDIPALVRHFLDRKAGELGLVEPPRPAPGEIDRLVAYPWPGNVRELENVVERALILWSGGTLDFRGLTRSGRRPDRPDSALVSDDFPTMDEAMAAHVRKALDVSEGRIEGPRGAARILGLKPSTLRNRMKKLGVRFERE